MGRLSLSADDKKRLANIEAKLEGLSKKVDEVATVVMGGDINDKTFQERLEGKIGKKKS